MTNDFSDSIPPPFAGWLEEHPEGAFLLLHVDGSTSPAIRSYEELNEYGERSSRDAADGAAAGLGGGLMAAEARLFEQNPFATPPSVDLGQVSRISVDISPPRRRLVKNVTSADPVAASALSTQPVGFSATSPARGSVGACRS